MFIETIIQYIRSKEIPILSVINTYTFLLFEYNLMINGSKYTRYKRLHIKGLHQKDTIYYIDYKLNIADPDFFPKLDSILKIDPFKPNASLEFEL